MIRVAIRFDDPSVATDHDLEVAIFDLLERYGIPATVAATPFHRQGECYQALTADSASHLVTAQHRGLIEIAQHSYSHEHAVPQSEARNPSLPASWQMSKLD